MFLKSKAAIFKIYIVQIPNMAYKIRNKMSFCY